LDESKVHVGKGNAGHESSRAPPNTEMDYGMDAYLPLESKRANSWGVWPGGKTNLEGGKKEYNHAKGGGNS